LLNGQYPKSNGETTKNRVKNHHSKGNQTMTTTYDINECQTGDLLAYTNNHGQLLTGTVVGWSYNRNKESFLTIKRPAWPNQEHLALTSFSNGTYTIVNHKRF
jgi:hypothetical protein